MSPRGPRLRVVCLNDVYTLEHLPRLRTLVLRERVEDPADVLLVVLAGDFLSPSMLSSLDAGAGMVDCMNAVPFTHVVLGNHEDDLELDQLTARLAELSATCLMTNVTLPRGARVASEVLEVRAPGGRAVKVGLLGTVMHDPTIYRRTPFGGAELRHANEAALAEAGRLLANGCDAVLPITHQPMAEDRALARAIGPERAPAIVGGHEHEAAIEVVDGVTIVKGERDGLEPVVLDLEWPAHPPAAGEPSRPRVGTRVIGVSELAADPELGARVARHHQKLAALEQATLRLLGPGESLSSVGARRQPTSLGTLLASMLRDRTDAEGALLNGGAIRAGRDYAARFTYADLRAEVPFDNEVVVASLPGGVIADAVEQSRAAAPRESGGFLHVDDGMEVAADGTLVRIAGRPLEPERHYRIATVRNFFAGLDKIEPLVRFAAAHPEAIPPADSGREVKVILVEGFVYDLFRALGPFSGIDRNHDGTLERAELAGSLAAVTDRPPPSLTIDLMLRALDTDHDGLVSREEAARATRKADASGREGP